METSIDLCFRLKQELGSFALMDNSGLGQLDFLQCCKFAEGDSRILMQKLSRDRMKLYKKGNVFTIILGMSKPLFLFSRFPFLFFKIQIDNLNQHFFPVLFSLKGSWCWNWLSTEVSKSVPQRKNYFACVLELL